MFMHILNIYSSITILEVFCDLRYQQWKRTSQNLNALLGNLVHKMYLLKYQSVQTSAGKFACNIEITTKGMTKTKHSFNKYNEYYLLLKVITSRLFKGQL